MLAKNILINLFAENVMKFAWTWDLSIPSIVPIEFCQKIKMLF